MILQVEELNDKVIIIAELDHGQEITLSLNRGNADFIVRQLRLFLNKED